MFVVRKRIICGKSVGVRAKSLRGPGVATPVNNALAVVDYPACYPRGHHIRSLSSLASNNIHTIRRKHHARVVESPEITSQLAARRRTHSHGIGCGDGGLKDGDEMNEVT